MNAQPPNSRCATCEHALVTGVACDASHPADCPLIQAFDQHKHQRSHLKESSYIPSDVALPEEYDAVRGED